MILITENSFVSIPKIYIDNALQCVPVVAEHAMVGHYKPK